MALGIALFLTQTLYFHQLFQLQLLEEFPGPNDAPNDGIISCRFKIRCWNIYFVLGPKPKLKCKQSCLVMKTPQLFFFCFWRHLCEERARRGGDEVTTGSQLTFFPALILKTPSINCTDQIPNRHSWKKNCENALLKSRIINALVSLSWFQMPHVLFFKLTRKCLIYEQKWTKTFRWLAFLYLIKIFLCNHVLWFSKIFTSKQSLYESTFELGTKGHPSEQIKIQRPRYSSLNKKKRLCRHIHDQIQARPPAL